MELISHGIQLVDLGVLHLAYHIRSPLATLLFTGLTQLGRDALILSITAVLSAYLIYKKRLPDMIGLWVAVLGASGSILFLKYAVARPRPDVLMQIMPEGAFYSFPSAHAGLSMALYGFCIYLLLQSYSTAMRRMAIAVLPALILLVGVSRLYLGVHFATDVLAGFAIGAFFVWAGIRFRLTFLR